MGLMVANQPYRIMMVILNYQDWEMAPMKSNLNKEGYGIYSRPGIQVFGNDTLIINVRLYKMTSYKMPKLGEILYYLPNADLHSVGIETDIPADNTEELQVRVFLNDTKEVSYKNYMHTETPYLYQRDNGTLLILVNADPTIVNTDDRIFGHGQTRYMIVYVCDRNDPGYFNEYYGLTIYSTVDEQQHSRIYEIKYP